MAVKGVAGSLNSPLPFATAARAVSVTLSCDAAAVAVRTLVKNYRHKFGEKYQSQL